jgi:hypothetical protein
MGANRHHRLAKSGDCHRRSWGFRRSPVLGEQLQSEEQLRNETGMELDSIRQVTYRVDELRPHPSYVRHHLTVPASQLSALAELGDLAFREPIVITRDRLIIDGYARVELARIQDRLTLPCSEYQLTEAEALRWLLQRHRRSNGLNAFSRILLALELELDFKERARSNQQAGGQNKGSSKLTEAERLDVRSAIAAAAGVSVGNVTKVKQLTMTAPPELLKALHTGEIRIHRAWKWRTMPRAQQSEHLRFRRMERGLRKAAKTLISRQRAESSPTAADLRLPQRAISMCWPSTSPQCQGLIPENLIPSSFL